MYGLPLQEDDEGEEDADTPQATAPHLLHPRPSSDASRRSLAAAPNPGVNAPVPDMAALQQHQQAGQPAVVQDRNDTISFLSCKIPGSDFN